MRFGVIDTDLNASDFATCSLSGSGFSRMSRLSRRYRPEGYARDFDDDTLWFDAVHVPGRVVLICPRLNNLSAVLRSARFRLDGMPVAARVRGYDRHAIIELDEATRPERVSVQIGNWRGESRVHAADTATFQGRNVIVTMSKDNELRWIHDFARFHVQNHGADAILFIDNGSSMYGPDEIEATLRSAGIAQPVVLSTTLKFGPRGLKPYRNSELYLQTCALNAARLRYLSQANAVLNCDIDELVHCADGTIFDHARRSRLGFVRFSGFWRFPAQVRPCLAVHADHTNADPTRGPCSDKWCLVPTGPLGRLQWRPHSLERLPFPALFRTREAKFWHCRAITTSWKGQNRLNLPEKTALDEQMASFLHALDTAEDAPDLDGTSIPVETPQVPSASPSGRSRTSVGMLSVPSRLRPSH